MADAPGLGPGPERGAGSSPASRNKQGLEIEQPFYLQALCYSIEKRLRCNLRPDLLLDHTLGLAKTMLHLETLQRHVEEAKGEYQQKWHGDRCPGHNKAEDNTEYHVKPHSKLQIRQDAATFLRALISIIASTARAILGRPNKLALLADQCLENSLGV